MVQSKVVKMMWPNICHHNEDIKVGVRRQSNPKLAKEFIIIKTLIDFDVISVNDENQIN